jgi:dephospho-CoA kinase
MVWRDAGYGYGTDEAGAEMIVIGLTGSIGMGKTTTAAMLQKLGVPVHDADAVVREVTSTGGKAVPGMRKIFSAFRYPLLYGRTLRGKRTVNRKELVRIVLSDPKALDKLEKLVHPMVRKSQSDFIRKHKGKKIVALDIPLLFETGGENFVDVTMVASAPYKVQRARVLTRAAMDEKKFRAILKRQMPDGEKRARADYVIHTGLGRAHAMKEVKAALRDIRKLK